MVKMNPIEVAAAVLLGIDVPKGTSLHDLDFDECKPLTRVFIGDFSRSTFTDADLSGICFAQCTLRGCDFSGANLIGANFYGANLEDAIFAQADVSNANFDSAYFVSRSGWIFCAQNPPNCKFTYFDE